MAPKKQANAALVKAVRAGDVSAVEEALRAGADPNVHAGYASALSDAANYRADPAVARAMTRALLDAGVDRAAITLKRRTELGVVLGKGATAAKIAKALGRAEVAAML